MPCTQTGSLEGDAKLLLEEELRGQTNTVTKLAQMLCTTCKILEKNQIEIPKGVRNWWKKHKVQDGK